MFNPSQPCEDVGTIILSTGSVWNDGFVRVVGFPKFRGLSGRAGPELRSVFSGCVRGPGPFSKLTDPPTLPSGSPTSAPLSVPRPGLAWHWHNCIESSGLVSDENSTWKKDGDKESTQSKRRKTEPYAPIECLETQKPRLSLVEILITVEKGLVWGVCWLGFLVLLFVFFFCFCCFLFVFCLFLSLFGVVLAVPHSLWDLSSPTRDRKHRVLTTGPPGSSLILFFKSFICSNAVKHILSPTI